MENNNWLSELSRDKKLPTFTSQRGEDRILVKIFQLIDATSKWCAEFGAADGKRGSNTWHLINNLGWSSVQIEPKRDQHLRLNNERDSFDALKQRYKGNKKVFCINSFVTAHGGNRLDKLLATTPIPREFDLLSIDIDSTDYFVWEALNEYHPRVVIIEHNKTIPIEVDFYSDRGSSLRALVRLGKQKGYELIAATIVNAVFVKREYFSRFGITNNSPEEIWNEHEQFRHYIWQLYDGTIVIKGDPKLRWARGYDSTIPGQLKSRKFIWLKDGMNTLQSKAQTPHITPTIITGPARRILYRIMRWL